MEPAMTDQREALLKTIKTALDEMDRAGGDGYGMPECPWCRSQSSDEQFFHAGDCGLVAAREALAALTPASSPQEATPPEMVRTIRNIRLSAAAGRVYGHGQTVHTLERVIERKDLALDQIINYCAQVGVVGSILRGQAAPPTSQEASAQTDEGARGNALDRSAPR